MSVPPGVIQAQEASFVIIRLDKSTYELNGWYHLTQPVELWTDSCGAQIAPWECYLELGDFLVLEQPLDLGWTKVVSRYTSQRIFEAEAIWQGEGQFLFPPDSLKNVALNPESLLVKPETLLYYHVGDTSGVRQADSAWNAIKHTDAIALLAGASGFSVLIIHHVYGLDDVDGDPLIEWIIIVGTTPGVMAVDPSGGSTIASDYRLQGNYPNPFNSATTITYELRRAGWVRLEMLNLQGRLVTTLVDARQFQGKHAITWDGRDWLGREATTGVYFYRLRVGREVQARKLLLLR